VALVVRGVDVHTIPARGEVDLSTDLVTGAGGEAWGLEGASVIHAHDVDGCVGEVGVVLGAAVGVASNHSEAVGESKREEALVT